LKKAKQFPKEFVRTGNQTREEWFIRKVRVVLLEVLFAGCDKFNGNKLKAADAFVSGAGHAALLEGHSPTVLETRDDGPNQSTLSCM
jgi:hypothetical protein